MRTLKNLFITLLALVTICVLAACGGENSEGGAGNADNNPPVHTHAFGEWETTKNATCTEVGELARYCSCGEVQSKPALALGHDEVSHEAKAPTCTEIGWDAYVTCSRCDYTTYAEKAALGHTPKSAVEENRVEATYTEDGRYDSVVYCNTCGTELSRTTVTVPKLKHTPKAPVQENYKSATCTEGAHYDSVVYCADCGEELERNKFTVSDPLGHDTATRQENRVEATCTENGSYDSVAYCKVCGDELSRSKIKIARNQSHTMSGGKCSVCDLPESSAGLKFSLNSDGKSYTVTGLGSCESTDIVIGVYNGLSVTTIGSYAFNERTSLTNVSIGDSVTTIGWSAFYNCTSLTSVSKGDSVTTIGGDAFYNCTSLTSVSIGDSVTTIGDFAFANCTSLMSITVDENNMAYKSIDGNLYTKDGKTLIQYAVGKTEKSFNIPSSVTTIGWSAFYYCTSLTSVVIPDSVTTIGDLAFEGCSGLKYNEYGNAYYLGNENNPYLWLIKAKDRSITSVNIHESTKFIYFDAFRYCTSLTSVVIPDSVTTIGDWAFEACSGLTSVVIPDSVTTIGYGAFSSCTSLTSVTIGNSVTTIGDDAFYGCTSLTSIKYRGTEEEWNAISKGIWWDYNTGDYTITCNYDGE